MKKLLSALAALVMLLSCLMAPAALADDKISVVTTIFPIYDWVREVAGDNLSKITAWISTPISPPLRIY